MPRGRPVVNRLELNADLPWSGRRQITEGNCCRNRTLCQRSRAHAAQGASNRPDDGA